MSLLSYATLLAATAATVNAHGRVTGVSVNGKVTNLGLVDYTNTPAKPVDAGWATKQGDLGFVSLSDTSGGLNCATGGVPGNTDFAVTAGTTMNFIWDHPGAGEVWPASHKGPTMTYLAKCPGTTCAGVDPSSLQYFKIQEEGIVTPGNPAVWSSDKFIANKGAVPVTIPAGLPDGAYVARHETIALHSAGSQGGAQLYPQCINLKVSGGSGTTPTTGVAAGSLYKATDPGILINIYQQLSSYTIPGPALVSGASSGGSSTGGGSGAAAPAPAPSSSSSAAAAAPPASKTTMVTKTSTKAAAAAATTSAAPAAGGASGSGSGAGAVSAKAMPSGTTLDDLLAWFKIVLNQTPTKRDELLALLL